MRDLSNFGLTALIEKELPLHERVRMQLRTELFNATNSVNFAGPQTAIASNALGDDLP
jgi:hypothetical protein